MPIMRVSEPTYDERKAGNWVFVSLPEPAELSTALDCFVGCANLGLRSRGSGARSPPPSARSGEGLMSEVSRDQVARRCLMADAGRHSAGGLSRQ